MATIIYEHGGRRKIGNLSYYVEENIVYISTVNVHPKARSKGVGSRLLNRVLTLFPSHIVKAKILGGYENISACRLFQGAGFVPSVIADELVMTRPQSFAK